MPQIFSNKYPGLVEPNPPVQATIEVKVTLLNDDVSSNQAYISESNTVIKNAERLIIQLGAFRKKITADGLMKRLREKGYEPNIKVKNTKDKSLYYRIRLRGYGSMAAARKARAQLAKQGFRDSFIVRPNKKIISSITHRS